MANQTLTLTNGLTIDNSLINANGTYTVYTSPTVNNNNGIQGVRVVLNYSNPSPNFVNVTAVLESQQGSMWFPIAYQFNSFNDMDNGPQRIIIMHPLLSSADAGIDDDIYVGGSVIARVSRQQGKVGSNLRLRLVVYENNYGQPNAFQNVTLSAYGELFD